MISYARQNPEEQPEAAPPSADDHIAPAPRVSVQAFCETVDTAAAVQAAGEDRRLGKAHLKIQMGGMVAAIEGLSHRADAERDHPGDRGAHRYPDRARPARHRVRRRNPRHRDRPHQRRHALPRTGPPRRQRLCAGARQRTGRGALDLRTVLGAGGQGGRPDRGHRRRQGRRRRVDHRAQRGLGDRARSRAGFRRRRSRPRLWHCRPRLQPGSRAGHRRRGVLAGPGRHRLHRPPAVEMHRPSQPAGGAGDARQGLRFRRRRVRFDFRHASHHHAVHRSRRPPPMVGLDQARSGERRRYPDRRGAPTWPICATPRTSSTC